MDSDEYDFNCSFRLGNGILICFMRRMMNRIKLTKLKSNSGESIAETLVSLLIASLAMIMLAGAINVSFRLIINSSSKLDEYYQANNDIEKCVDSSGEKSITVTCEDTAAVWISGEADVYENTVIGNDPLTAYRFRTTDGE